jgi:hypothetical protein
LDRVPSSSSLTSTNGRRPCVTSSSSCVSSWRTCCFCNSSSFCNDKMTSISLFARSLERPEEGF